MYLLKHMVSYPNNEVALRIRRLHRPCHDGDMLASLPGATLSTCCVRCRCLWLQSWGCLGALFLVLYKILSRVFSITRAFFRGCIASWRFMPTKYKTIWILLSSWTRSHEEIAYPNLPSARSFSLKISRNSSRCHSVLILPSLSTVTNLSLQFGF